MTQDTRDQYDVVVIGGGAAGPAGAHGYLTRDGMPPADPVRTGRLEVQGYGGRTLDGQVERVHRSSDGRLTVALGDERTLTGRRLPVATGLVDELPYVPGPQERWRVGER